jgi:signal transduction histidine kinase
LTSINLNLQGLARDARAGRMPNGSATAIDICLFEIQRLDSVVGGVLTLAQAAPTQLVCASLHSIVRDTLRVIASQASALHVRVETALTAERDDVACDGARLHAAILNVLINALAAMPDGGLLRITTVTVDTPSSGSRILLRISDTGLGVPRSERERIFRPFHTTRPNGTGLGLPIARRTIDAHGGSLTLDDLQSDAGATFVIELPLANAST